MEVQFQKTVGKSRDEILDYIHAIDRWDWRSYDYTQWPSADMSFADLGEDEERDLWPYKPDLTQAHWIDLYSAKSGAQRKLWVIQNRFDIPDSFEPGASWDEVFALIQEIEEARNEDMEEFQDLLEEHDLESAEHFDHVKEVAELSKKANWAAAQKDLDKANALADKMVNANIAKVKAGGDLDPFKGISIEDWAAANAKMASGSTLEDILKVLNIERPLWDEVTAEWNARMSRDTTASIAKVYGDAFVNSNIGKFALAHSDQKGAESNSKEISFEKWIEIQEAMTALTSQGQDAGSVLNSFGMNEADWGMLGAQMSTKMASDISLIEKFDEYSEKYRTKYAGATSADDIEF